VFSYATKLLAALTGSAVVGAIVYYAVVGDKSGAVLMLFLALAALVALATVVATAVDTPPVVAVDAPAPERRATTPGEPGRPSLWPLATAFTGGVLAVGLATSAPVVEAGVVLLVLCAFGWFANAWRDHPSWAGRVSTRVTNRLVAPFGTPLIGFVLVLVIAVSLSRVLLASNEKVAPVIALVAALLVLFSCFWIASRPRIGSSVLVGLAGIAGVAIIGAGVAGASQGERHFEEKSPVPAPLKVEAKGVKFLQTDLSAPANTTVTLVFKNDDAGTYHNVAVYTGSDAAATPVFNGAGVKGAKTAKYTFQTPAPGTYTFRCDFHANMVGTLTVGGG
jgi:plastocyanin